MDEQELRSLFSAAPGEAPPPTFGQADVVAESKRLTRRRNRFLTAGAAVLVVVAGLGVADFFSSGLPGFTAGKDNAASAPANSGPLPGQPGGSSERPFVGGESPNFSTTPSQQGGDGAGKTGPTAEGAFGCEKVDGELATALAGELSAHGAVPGAATPGGACTTGARSAGFPVPGGTISVALFPKGTPPVYVQQQSTAVRQTAITKSGGTIMLVSTPDGAGQAPLADLMLQFAADLGRRF
jgi:hypothetical protein